MMGLQATVERLEPAATAACLNASAAEHLNAAAAAWRSNAAAAERQFRGTLRESDYSTTDLGRPNWESRTPS